MIYHRENTICIHGLADLRRGDTLEVHRYGTVRYRGIVDDIIPAQNIWWLRHGPWQERVLLETDEYELRRITNTHPQMP